jgi:peptide/nickel transport system substrate-binding protein/oligopeptide transport system substrate-binding protein
MKRGVLNLSWIALVFCALAFQTPCRAKEKILHLARIIDPQTLDPALVQLAEDYLLQPLLSLSLLDITNNTELIPLAAKDWSASPDFRVYTVHLRSGLRFSNGREVVAGDYVYQLERIINPATAAMMKDYFKHVVGTAEFDAGKTNHVRGLQAPDPETLVITLDRTDPTFPYLLVGPAGTAVPREEVERDRHQFALRPVTAGPYKVKSWVRGARLELEKNPSYNGPIPQYFDGIELMIGVDEFTQLLMFERGEIDIANIITGIPFPDLRHLREEPRWRGAIESTSTPTTYALIMNCEIPPFNNVLVRRAMNHAVNRDRRMKVRSGVMVHAEGIIPPVLHGYDPNFKGYDFDPKKARELLRESGVPLPIHTVLWHSTEEGVRTMAQGVQADLKDVGVELDLKMVSYGELITAAETRGKVPMLYSGWSCVIPDPVDMLGTQFDGRAVTNSTTMNKSF